jgi:hypothetical protein
MDKKGSWLGKFFKQFFEGNQRQTKEASKVKIAAHCRGGFGEPYCSGSCYQISDENCGRLYMEKDRGVCQFCGTLVELSSIVFSGRSGNGLAFPMPGRLSFICDSASCLTKAKALASTITECCMCGKSLKVSQDEPAF